MMEVKYYVISLDFELLVALSDIWKKERSHLCEAGIIETFLHGEKSVTKIKQTFTLSGKLFPCGFLKIANFPQINENLSSISWFEFSYQIIYFIY